MFTLKAAQYSIVSLSCHCYLVGGKEPRDITYFCSHVIVNSLLRYRSSKLKLGKIKMVCCYKEHTLNPLPLTLIYNIL